MSQNNQRVLRIGRSFSITGDENQPVLPENRPSRKRKEVSRALEDISNSQETPSKIARVESSDHAFLQKNESPAEAMDEDESGIEVSSCFQEPPTFENLNTHKLLLDENLQIIGTVEEIPYSSLLDDTAVECLELTCAEDNICELSFNDVICSSQHSLCSEDPVGSNTGDFLQDHIIMSVMDYLPIKDRLTLSLTSQHFNAILKDNPNRFPFILNLEFDDFDGVPDFFVRCYREVKVEQLKTPITEDRIEKVKGIFKSIGDYIYDIQFSHCDMTFEVLSSLIMEMPNITSLQMESTVLHPSANDIEWPELTSLKKVNVNGLNIENIAKILANVTTIEEFVFSIPTHGHRVMVVDTDDDDEGSDGEENEDNHDNGDIIENDRDIVGFMDNPELEGIQFNDIKVLLARQVNLHTLEIIRGSFFAEPFETNGIQLKKLVLFIPWCTPDQLLNMKQFIKSQTKLDSVVLNVLCRTNADFNESYDHLVKLPSLKDLRIVFYDEPQMAEHYRNYTFVNANVKDVYLGLQGISPNYREILDTTRRLYPNVTKLHLNMDTNPLFTLAALAPLMDNLAPIADVLAPLIHALSPLVEFKRLDTLTIDRVLTQLLREIRNPTLTNFTATGILVSSIEDWNIFFRNNPAIENIRLQFVHLGRCTILEFLEAAAAHLPKIENIKICYRDPLAVQDDPRVQQIFNNSNSIKSITFCRFKLVKLEGNRVILRKNNGDSISFPREREEQSSDDE